MASTVCFKIWIDSFLPPVPSKADVEPALVDELSPEYASAILNGDKASSPAVVVVVPLDASAYLTLNVWICPTGPVIGCTPTNSLAITVGITRLITGRITLFKVATLPAEVLPTDADSLIYFLVFSRVTSITDFLLPFSPSNNADFVSDQRASVSSDILFVSYLFCLFINRQVFE